MSEKALVLFSGGQDSAIALAWALDRFESVETIGFDYCQTHRVELEVRQDFLGELRESFPDWITKLGDDRVLDLGVLADIGGSSLTGDQQGALADNGLPDSFVPGRNLMFLMAAAALAYRQGADHLVTGVGEIDYSGYPDCRESTMKALEPAINRGMDSNFTLHYPLMKCDKATSWSLAHLLGGDPLIDLILEQTHSCYEGVRDTRHDWGYGCGACPACELRQAGWQQFVRESGRS